VHRDLHTQQEKKILVQKRNNRWLCLPSKASIQVRQEKQIKTNSNKVTPSYPKKKNNVREKTNQDSKQPVKETRSCNTTRKQEEK
jgi:hypothetical protein